MDYLGSRKVLVGTRPWPISSLDHARVTKGLYQGVVRGRPKLGSSWVYESVVGYSVGCVESPTWDTWGVWSQLGCSENHARV